MENIDQQFTCDDDCMSRCESVDYNKCLVVEIGVPLWSCTIQIRLHVPSN